MRVACSTSFRRGDLPATLDEIAELGFAEVDLIAIPGWGHLAGADLLADFDGVAGPLEAQLGRRGLTAIAGNMAIGALYQRDETLAGRLAEAEAIARLMGRLGVRLVSCYAGYRSDRPLDDLLADTVATLRDLAGLGAPHGVRFILEPHFATPWESVEAGEALLAAMPELGVAYDPSHYAMQGIPLEATLGILDRAVHVHLRHAAPDRMQAPAADSTVEVDGLVDALRARGYTGDASLEFLPDLPGDVAAELVALRERIVARWEAGA